MSDPASIKALLDQLRESDEWQKVASTSASSAPIIGGPLPLRTTEGPGPMLVDPSPESADAGAIAVDPRPSQPTAPPATAPTPSVAELLSQLQQPVAPPPGISSSGRDLHLPAHGGLRGPSRPPVPFIGDARASADPPTFIPVESPTPEPAAPRKDPRSLNYAESLTALGRLSSDAEFLSFLKQLKREQDELERKLATEREGIRKKHEEKVRVAKTKATMIGGGISAHEADMLQRAYRKDLENFDRERVLSAWRALVKTQQAAMEKRAVPAMFVTTAKADMQRQKRVISVLEDMISD
ncbi:uncharacterized protein SCHCODRAFT_02624477 [Schizophyllum commune H4-8]|nr:uncharacterized protein SCHCODRAFT_02624477 [Schizophyllum commune H4-8]KAI5894373.1 hypothetical protein SCHCODRAFT_02624477 [Schizophyllum commune H4-8]